MRELLTNIGLLWLRLLVGSGIAYHGYGKIFGGKMAGFTEGVAAMGLPAPEFFAWAAALSEFLGGVFIALGLCTRPAALFVFITMSVAVFIKHSADPFKQKELALAYWAVSSALVLLGPGIFSLDHVIRLKKPKA